MQGLKLIILWLQNNTQITGSYKPSVLVMKNLVIQCRELGKIFTSNKYV